MDRLEFGTISSTIDDKSNMIKKKGLSVLTAAVFIVGEMAGTGILALPKAVANSGWLGIILIVFCAIASVRICLWISECWLIIEKKWPQYQGHCRDPYPTIGDKSIGLWMKKLTSLMMDVQLFGSSLVLLLLCAEQISLLISPFVNISYCNLIIILGAFFCPFTWLGSPADFSFIAFGAIISTLISCLIVVSILIMEGQKTIIHAEHSSPTLRSFLLGLSTIIFAYAGTVTLPTIQNDMHKKEHFSGAVYIGFITILAIYLPIGLGSYIVFGDSVDDDIMHSFASSPLTSIVNILMAFHVFCAFMIIINPVNQDIEQQIGLNHSFNFKRSASRTMVVILIVFTGLTVPKFGKILNLVGAATVIPQSFILPPWFYWNLIKKTGQKKPSFFTIIQLSLICTFGIVFMIIATYFAVTDLFASDSFTKPCYC